jgi:2-methylisocitrate lyase-like PEP mutase family enzyme
MPHPELLASHASVALVRFTAQRLDLLGLRLPTYRSCVTSKALPKTGAALRALHVPGRPVKLPNAWDAASARAVAAAGFPAVGTASAAMCEALGYRDHEDTPAHEMFAAITRIARSVDVPVTADVEHGYGLSPRELVERLIETGAVGCNLEDTDPRTGRLVPPEQHADYLAGVRHAAAAVGVDLVVNARADTRVAVDGAHLAEVIGRCRRYRAAGADCVFPIFTAPSVVADIVAAVDAPVAVLYRPGWPSLTELAALGVARISFGPGLHRAAIAFVDRMLQAIRDDTDPYRP